MVWHAWVLRISAWSVESRQTTSSISHERTYDRSTIAWLMDRSVLQEQPGERGDGGPGALAVLHGPGPPEAASQARPAAVRHRGHRLTEPQPLQGGPQARRRRCTPPKRVLGHANFICWRVCLSAFACEHSIAGGGARKLTPLRSVHLLPWCMLHFEHALVEESRGAPSCHWRLIFRVCGK